MTDQIPLFVETIWDALRATIEGIGGYKSVGHELKPELSVDAAGRWLADCCNPDKRDVLSPLQMGYIRKRARQMDVHTLTAFENRDAGYAEPIPLEPEEEQAKLARELTEQLRKVELLMSQAQRIGLVGVRS